MSSFKFVLLIVLTLLVVVFAVKNMDLVEISFYDFSLNSRNLRVPLLVVILCSIAFGFTLSWVGGWISQVKQKALIRRKDKAIAHLQSELDKVRPPDRPALPQHTESSRR